MVFFLVFNIPNNLINLAFSIRKRTISFLPCKRLLTEFLCLYPLSAFRFHILH